MGYSKEICSKLVNCLIEGDITKKNKSNMKRISVLFNEVMSKECFFKVIVS